MTASVRTVSCTLAASLGLHGLLLLLAAWFLAVLPVWTKDTTRSAALPALAEALLDEVNDPALQEVEVNFLSLVQQQEKLLPPPPLTPPASPSPAGNKTIRPQEDQPALAPFNKDTPFISSQNMRAASTSAPKAGADPNLLNLDGHEGAGLSLVTNNFSPGSEAQPASASTPPEPPAAPVPSPESPDPVVAANNQAPPPNERPPEPAAAVKTSDPLAPAPADKPAEPLAMRETLPEPLALTKPADSPVRSKSPPVTPRDPISGKPNPGQVSRSPVVSSVKSKSAGAIAVRGDRNSMDARDTPEGRYNNSVYERVGLMWNARIATVRGLAGRGSVEVEFDIDAKGRISNVRLVDPGKANPVLEDACLSAIIKAKLPPPPAEMQREMTDPLAGGKLRRKFSFQLL